MTIAAVHLWGRVIGAVVLEEGQPAATFQYDEQFARSGIQVAPLMMPLRDEPYSFPALSYESFKGLPGLLADSLPDKFGNALIDVWLAQQQRPAWGHRAANNYRPRRTVSDKVEFATFRACFREDARTHPHMDENPLIIQ